MINKYYDFILESKVTELINEGLLAYSKEFLDTLELISNNKIGATLLKLSLRDCDVNANYITIGDRKDTAKFIQDNKLDSKDLIFTLRNRYRFLGDGYQLVKLSGFSTKGLISSFDKLSNRFRLLDTKAVDIGDETYKLFHLQFLDDPSKHAIVYDIVSSSETILEVIGDVDTSKGSDIKIGRLASRILSSFNISYTNKDIEEFVNKYISCRNITENIFDSFKVVSGEDIRVSYLVNNYYDSPKARESQLWKSCMSYKYCQSYLDIYVENPDKISLLVFINEEKVMGRALLWNVDGGVKFMDRIYTVADSYIDTFKKWGEDNGYELYGDYKEEMIVSLKADEYYEYPYMDTFVYYNFDGLVSNESDALDDYITLNETDGGYS